MVGDIASALLSFFACIIVMAFFIGLANAQDITGYTPETSGLRSPVVAEVCTAYEEIMELADPTNVTKNCSQTKLQCIPGEDVDGSPLCCPGFTCSFYQVVVPTTLPGQ